MPRELITVQEADAIILSNIKEFETESCPLEKAFGSVLREDVFADRDIPSLDKVLMDGIAIKFSVWESGVREFRVEGTQAAGKEILTLANESGCIEIMTGAGLPKGCDCVIPVENITLQNGTARIVKDIKITPMLNVKKRGSDRKKGEQVLKINQPLLPPQIAVAAAVGKADVKVARCPKVAIITTGDELVGLGEPVADYQVRKSNSYALEAGLTRNGFDLNTIFHVVDNKKKIAKVLMQAIDEHDVLILTGGVSMGKYDFIPDVLEELKVAVLFHRVQQKPGKPFWFGKSQDKKPVFALPGNPVSTQVCFYRYVLPALKRMTGIRAPGREMAVLTEHVDALAKFTLFLPVQIKSSDGPALNVSSHSISHSGDFTRLADSDGFVEIVNGRAGDSVPFYRW